MFFRSKRNARIKILRHDGKLVVVKLVAISSLLLMLLSWLTASFARDVVRSSTFPDRIIVELLPFELSFSSRVVNGDTFAMPAIPDFEFLQVSGKPKLPVKRLFLSVPPAKSYRLAFLETEYDELLTRPIYPSEIHDIESNDRTTLAIDKFYFNKEFYHQDVFFPETIAEIIATGKLRHQQGVLVEIHPVQYNPVTRKLKKYNRLRIAIYFETPGPGSINQITSPEQDIFANVYQHCFNNAKDVFKWTASGDIIQQNRPGNEFLTSGQESYKASINRDGVYRLDYHYLDSLGIQLSSFNPVYFRLFNKGKEVPLYVSGESDGKFDPPDYLEFYGERNRPAGHNYFDPYSDINVYRLVLGDQPGARFKPRAETGLNSLEVNNFISVVHLEQEVDYYYGDTKDDIINPDMVSGEGWIWKRFYPGDIGLFNIFIANVAKTTEVCSLAIRLRGITTDIFDPDHHVEVSWQNFLLGDRYFNDNEEVILSYTFPLSYISAGNNIVKIKSVGDTGAKIDEFYLDWIEFKYPQDLITSSDYLEFCLPDLKGIGQFQLWNFSQGDIKVFDITTGGYFPEMFRSRIQRNIFEIHSGGMSDGNIAHIFVNSYDAINSGRRGHNLVVVSASTGTIKDILYFDTYQSTSNADSMAEFLENLPDSMIVLMAIRDDGSVCMTNRAYRALELFGSQYARKAGYRDSWALIGQKGAPLGSVPEKWSPAGSGPVIVVDTLITKGSNYAIAYKDSVFQPKKYVAFSAQGVFKPLTILKDEISNLRSIDHGADYIIIYHPEFYQAAQRLADYRRHVNGFRVQLVKMEDIYDEFNDGIIAPEAIQKFLRYAFQHWQPPAPAFVLLFGDASEDMKQNQPSSIKDNFIPSYGRPSNDTWFVCLDGLNDFLPDMLIGRLPAETLAEAELLVDKIIRYESNPPAAWNKYVTFVTGGFNNYEQGMFIDMAQYLKNKYVLPPPAGCIAREIHKTTPGWTEGEKTEEIAAAMNHGTLWVNFQGHGGSQWWGLMFHNPDIEMLNNRDELPFVTSLSCYTGTFAHPSITSLGEELINTDHGGAIAFWGTPSLSYNPENSILLKTLFPTILVDTVHTLGQATTICKIEAINWLGWESSIVNRVNGYALLGDPAVDLSLAKQPDLAMTTKNVKVVPENLTESDTTAVVTIKVENYGLATNDSVGVTIKDVTPEQNEVKLDSGKFLNPLRFADSTSVIWRLVPQLGRHHLVVEIDPMNVIDEANEQNNNIEIPIDILSTGISISKPMKFDVVATTSPMLQVNNSQIISPINNCYFFEIDSTADFNSPLLMSSDSIKEGSLVTRWRTPELINGLNYFWRCRRKNGHIETPWAAANFIVDQTQPGTHWRQTGDLLKNNQLTQTSYDGSGITLAQNKLIFKVTSAGGDDGNHARIYLNSQPVEMLVGRGYNMVIFDEREGLVLVTGNFDTYDSQSAVERMAAIIDSTASGRIVAIGIADDGSTHINDHAYQSLEAIGSQYCRQVGFRDSWAIIGRKDAIIGSVPEQLTKRYQGPAVVTDTVRNIFSQGQVLTPEIGPAKSWQFLHWLAEGNSIKDGLWLRILGYNRKSARWDTLGTLRSADNFSSLELIEGTIYPKIKLGADFTRAEIGPQLKLKGWEVQFEPAPDLALSPATVSLSADSVLEGTAIDILVTVFNVGYTTVDSAKINYYFASWQGDRILYETQSIKDLPVDSSITFSTDWNSSAHFGKNKIYIELDPENSIFELSETNNNIVRSVYVERDTVRPECIITFDGREIIDGDYVASQPGIVVRILDHSPLKIEDTTRVNLFLDQNRINFNSHQSRLAFVSNPDPLNSHLKAAIYFDPILEEGDHTLELFIKDASNNTTYKRIDFAVIIEFQILKVINFPNPFPDDTEFTFHLTQPADRITIKIYTVVGRLLRTLEQNHIEAGFQHVYWNGRDQDQNEIANGVYLYRVIARAGDKQVEQIEKLVIMR